MALSIGGNKSAAKGVYVNKMTITQVEDLSGQTLPFLNNSYDLAVKVTGDIGKSFPKEMTIFGNFKKDADGQVIGIGAAFKVGKIFEVCGIKGELTPQNTLPPEWLTQIIGKEVYVLEYAIGTKDNGKTKYATHDLVDTDPDFLTNDFFGQVKKGFPKKYVEWLSANDTNGDAYEGAASEAPAPVEEDFVF